MRETDITRDVCSVEHMSGCDSEREKTSRKDCASTHPMPLSFFFYTACSFVPSLLTESLELRDWAILTLSQILLNQSNALHN